MSGSDDDLTGDYPADTYKSLLHTDSATGLTSSFQQVYDGGGKATTIEVSTAGTRITDITINGTTSFGDANQVRTALGLGTMAVEAASTYPRVTFKTISIAGQSDVVADDKEDTLTLVAGSGITLTTNAGSDSITFAVSGLMADGDYGDIVVSSSGAVLSVDSGVISYAKMQNVSATDKILGRSSGGSGVVEEITCTAAGRALIDDANAAAQRATLGLTIGTDVQAWDATLDSLASFSVNGIVVQSATDTFTSRTITGTANQVIVTNGNGVSGNPTLSTPQDIATSSSPQFTGLNIGHASDTTVTRASAGDINVEGNLVYRSGGTDVPITDGGTGQSTKTAGFDALAPTTTQGDLIFHNGTNNARLAAGTSTYVLTSNGAGTSPTWQAAAGGIVDGDYGDIIVSGGGTVLTIDNDVVTYAKMQNVSATDKLLGRSTAGSGDVEEIVCTAAGRALIDDANTAAQRTTLGVVIGTDVEAHDATLTALASYNTNGLLTQTASDTFTGRTLTGTANQVIISNGDGVSGNPTFTLPQSIATSSNPQFATIELGSASDTTISRAGAGDLAIEGNQIYRVGGTDVALADGGTGATLVDPNADRIMFWDDSAGQVTWLTAGSGLTITGTTLTAASSISMVETEVDFGSTPVGETTAFTITDATVSGTSKIMLSLSGAAPTGKDQDELEMDAFHMWALPGSGSFSLYMRPLEGFVHDKFKVNYIVG